MNDDFHCARRTDGELLSSRGPLPANADFAELFARHSHMVFSTAMRITANAHDSEDVLQATFLVLLKKAKQLREAKDIGGWLYQVATRLARKTRTRALNYEIRLEKYSRQEGARPSGSTSEALSILDEVLARVPEKYRSSLVLCYLEQKSHEQTGSALGLTPDAVKYRLERGKELLRQGFSKHGITLSIPALAGLLMRAESASAATFASTPSGILASFSSSTSGLGLTWQFLRSPFGGRPVYEGLLAASLVAVIGVGTVICSAKEPKTQTPVDPNSPAAALPPNPKKSSPESIPATAPAPSVDAKEFWCELKEIEVHRIATHEVVYPDGKPQTQVAAKATIRIWVHGPKDAKINWPDSIWWRDWTSPAFQKGKDPVHRQPESGLTRGLELETVEDADGRPLHEKLTLNWKAKGRYFTPPSPDVLGEIIITGHIAGDTYSRTMGRLKGVLQLPVWTEIEEIEFNPLSDHLGQVTSLGPDSNLTFTQIGKDAVYYTYSWTKTRIPFELDFFQKDGTQLKPTTDSFNGNGLGVTGHILFAEPVVRDAGFYAIARFASKTEDIVVPFEFTDVELPAAPGMK